MAEGGNDRAGQVDNEIEIEARVRNLLRSGAVRREKGTVAVGDEVVQYEICVADAWAEAPAGSPGNPAGASAPIVVVPGHGQTVEGPRKLVATAALLSKSKIAWCIDPVPSRGGDRIEGMAIAQVTRRRLAAAGLPPRATLVGWSHGGAEALRAAAHDPEIFPQYLGLCPTGLIDRRPLELLASFFLEVLRILGRCLRRGAWARAGDTLRMGLNLFVGLLRDLRRGRSLRRLVEDVAWAAGRVTGQDFGYTGEVVILCGTRDTVVRWRDALPGCASSTATTWPPRPRRRPSCGWAWACSDNLTLCLDNETTLHVPIDRSKEGGGWQTRPRATGFRSRPSSCTASATWAMPSSTPRSSFSS